MTTDFRALYVDLLEEINSIIDVAQGSLDEGGENDDLMCLASIALIARRASNALAKPLLTPTIKDSLTVQNEELPMAEPLLEGTLTMPFMGINAACLSRKLPEAVRLVTTEDHNGNAIYKLQGFFAWRQGAEFGGEWRLLETQDELFAEDDIPYGLLP